MITYREFEKKISKTAYITLGELIELAGYDLGLLVCWLDKLHDNFVLLSLIQNDSDGEPVMDETAVWDGGLTFVFSKREFWYIGTDGPGGGSGKTNSVLVRVNDVFEVC